MGTEFDTLRATEHYYKKPKHIKQQTNRIMILRYLKGAVLALALASTAVAFAAEPAGYYSTCENKSGAALLSALCKKVGPHTNVGYNGLLSLYKTSDVYPDGTIWDMYSTKHWKPGTTCGNYKKVGDCYNREHSFPKSWFNDAQPMYSEAFHIYPTDGKVNGQRSNFPYGECAKGTTLPSNGNVKALGRLGDCTFPGYSGTVFEPDDQYKGDFARSYFYMAAAYNDQIAGWNSKMLAGNSYPVFSSWAINLLLKWHREDPVSQKELDRQEVVYGAQHNRNPFIDHPELAEYIWGNKKGQNWSTSISADPAFLLPTDGSTVDFGVTAVGLARTKAVTVKAEGLKEAISVSVSGTGFAAGTTSIAADASMTTDGTTLTLTYTAPAAGAATGTLTLTSGTAKTTVKLTANAMTGLPVGAATDISDESFVAHWTYVGDEAADGTYTLHLLDAEGKAVASYPRTVKAKDEQYICGDLTPETAYTYYVASKSLTSDKINVTTAAPIPSIEFMHDGELSLVAEPGTPSEAEELIVEVENINSDITIEVKAPFELSTNKADWAQKIVIKPEEDRIYIRVNSAKAGTFASSIIATAKTDKGETYTTDEAEVSAKVTEAIDFFEDFEAATTKSGYDDATVQGTMCVWNLHDAGVFAESKKAYKGSNYMRLGKSASSSFATAEDIAGGVGEITFYAKAWDGAEACTFKVDCSTDGGNNWKTAATITLPKGEGYKKYTVTANVSGDVRVRFAQTAGNRAQFDNIAISHYRGGIEGVESDYHAWTAYSLNGQLIVSLIEQAKVQIYGIDGITYFNGTLNAGDNALDLAKGLYIVVVDDFSRRVLVK